MSAKVFLQGLVDEIADLLGAISCKLGWHRWLEVTKGKVTRKVCTRLRCSAKQ
jgi:hypothetical protein